MFDKQPVQSIGAVAIDPTTRRSSGPAPARRWTRNSVSIGDGIYKSTDGGDTWTNIGLPESERIAQIAVHPTDGQTVYACVPGKLWSDSTERGVYKTTDGGKTWTLVLKGAQPLDRLRRCSPWIPKVPNRLFASLWDFRRKGWTFRSGGESPDAPSGSGLFMSNDGGDDLVGARRYDCEGPPRQAVGRVAVAVAPSDPSLVYTVIECARSALFAPTTAERPSRRGIAAR